MLQGQMTMYGRGTAAADHHVRIKYYRGRRPCTDKVPQVQITMYVRSIAREDYPVKTRYCTVKWPSMTAVFQGQKTMCTMCEAPRCDSDTVMNTGCRFLKQSETDCGLVQR